jgi:general secretion pathway protein G
MKHSGNILLALAFALCIILLSIFFIAPRFFGCTDKSPWDLTIPMMSPIEAAINAYHLNTGQYPKTLDDLIKCPAGLEAKWAGPYLKEKQLFDPWGFEYMYEPNSVNPAGYDLISYGRDGKPGGEGYNADQHN